MRTADRRGCRRRVNTGSGKARPGICRRGRHAQVVIDHHDPRPRPAQRRCALGQRVLQPRRFGMLKDLLPARLPYVNHRCPVPVPGPDLLLRLAPRPVPAQAHHARLLPGRPPPGLPAAPAAPPPPPAAPAAASSRPGAGEPPLARHSVASGSPAAARSRPTMVAACNSAPTLTIALGTAPTLEHFADSGALQVAD